METGFTFADVYDEVISRTGGEQSTAEDVIRVRRGLRLLLERWEAKGYNTWRIRCHTIYAGGYGPVSLPHCLDDVIHVTHKNGGTLERIPPDRYMAIARKGQRGRPAEYWLQRDECPKLHLHPSGNGEPLDVWYVERPEEFSPVRSNIDDIPGRWLEAVILGLAYDLSRKRPRADGTFDEGLISRLQVEFLDAEDTALRADRDRSRYRYRIA